MDFQEKLSKLGFRIERTGYDFDGVFEATALKHTFITYQRYVIRWKTNGTQATVFDVGWLYLKTINEQADYGVFICSEGFTSEAKEFARQTSHRDKYRVIKLWGLRELEKELKSPRMMANVARLTVRQKRRIKMVLVGVGITATSITSYAVYIFLLFTWPMYTISLTYLAFLSFLLYFLVQVGRTIMRKKPEKVDLSGINEASIIEVQPVKSNFPKYEA